MHQHLLRWLRRALTGMLLILSLATSADAAEFRNPPPELSEEAWTPPALPPRWQTVPGIAFHAHGHLDDDRILRALSAHGEAALPRLAKALGVAISADVHVFVARSQEEFRQLQPGAPPGWADGTAYPEFGAIFLRHPDLRGGLARPLEQVLEHEMIHVLLGRAFHPKPTPRWLQEGVAQVYSGEAGPEITERVSRGLRGSSAFSLADLEGSFPADVHRADLAYAQSADFIQWFRATYGPDAVRALIRETRTGASLGYAVRQVTGTDLATIDSTWRSRLVSAVPVWTTPESLDVLLWGGTGFLILAVGFTRRRRWVRRLATWKDEDRALANLTREVLLQRRGTDPG